MRYRLLLLLLLLLSTASAVVSQIETEKGRWSGPVRISYSERQNETTCEVSFPVYGQARNGIFMSVRNVSPGNKIARADSVTFIISASGKDRTYLDDASFRIFLDNGSTLDLTAVLETHSVGQTVSVVRTARLSFADFVRVTQATKVQMQIGPTQFDLSESRLADLRALVTATEPERPVYPQDILRAFQFPADSKATNEDINAKLIAMVRLRRVRFLLDEKLIKEFKATGANAELLKTIDTYLTPATSDGTPDDQATIEKKKSRIRELDEFESKVRQLYTKHDIDSKKQLIDLGKAFLKKYGNDADAVDMAEWLRMALPILERSVADNGVCFYVPRKVQKR